MTKMNIERLRKIIAEEVRTLLEYEEAVIRKGDKLYIYNDEGEREFFGMVYDHPEYEHLSDAGGGEPWEGYGGSGGYYSSSRRYRRRY